ncbi:MAG: inositol monophosphatase family protein [Pseudomonadota bacterium]
MSDTLDELLGVARQAAEAAAERLMAHYRTHLTVQTKPDGTPVTVADEEAEQVIREIITDAFPNHGFYGEEGGAFGLDRPVVWLVDPLDGTKSFVRRTPFFSTQIAAMAGGRLVVGVSSAPAFGEMAWAHAESDAMLNGEMIRVSDVGQINDASISTGNIGTLARSSGWDALGEVLSHANRTRGYGDFCHYHMLASGRVDAVIESDVNILDVAALSVIVERAGGVFTDLGGKPLDLDTSSVLAATPGLHQPLLERFT